MNYQIEYEPRHRPDWLAVVLTMFGAMLAIRMSAGAEIVGPERVDEHRLAIYEAKGGEKSSYAWTVHPIGQADVHEHNGSVIFTGRPGTYTLQLIEVGPTDDPARPFAITQTFRTVHIGKAPPTPPGPGPDPPPMPDLTGLAKTVYDLAKAGNDKATAKQLADNYDGVISGIVAGAYAGDLKAAKGQIVKDLYSLNHPLTADKPAFQKMFTELDKHMTAEDKAGKLATLNAIAETFRQIVAGLREAAK